jgi:hypothetical protein
MGLKQRIREQLVEKWNITKELCRETTVEIWAVAVLGAFAGSCHQYNTESDRERLIPHSFSEIEYMEDLHQRAGDPIESRPGHRGFTTPHGKLDPLTAYYAVTNDLTAKVFEAAGEDATMFIQPPGAHQRNFAYHLDRALDVNERIYRHNLKDLFDAIPYSAREALVQLNDVQTVRNSMPAVIGSFDGAWSYSYHDNTHQSCTTTTDSKGHSTTSCHTVCDSRDHYWNYNPQEGRAALRFLRSASQRQPTIDYHSMQVPNVVHAENRGAIRRVFRIKEDSTLTEEQYVQRAQLFKTGSAYEVNIHPARSEWTALQQQDIPAWERALRTAHSEQERTFFCSSTTGPAEYELARAIGGRAQQLATHTSKIVDPIFTAARTTAELERNIQLLYLHTEGLRGHYPHITDQQFQNSPSARTLANRVFSQTQHLYLDNFPAGNDVKQFRWYMIPLIGLLGAAIGAAAGFGLDAAGNRFNLWGKPDYGSAWQRGRNNYYGRF